MTVKSTVSFTDRHHMFAHQKVQEGTFASVSSIVANGIEQMMQDEIEHEAALNAMKNTIKRRMETPREEWIEMNTSDDLFSRAKARLNTLQR